jgi:hypothetical protein
MLRRLQAFNCLLSSQTLNGHLLTDAMKTLFVEVISSGFDADADADAGSPTSLRAAMHV